MKTLGTILSVAALVAFAGGEAAGQQPNRRPVPKPGSQQQAIQQQQRGQYPEFQRG